MFIRKEIIMKKNIQEKEIIRKFQKAQTANMIITVVSLLILPLIAVGGLLAEHNQLEIEKPLLYLFLSIVAIVLLSNIFLRRCPHCGAFMGKYRIFPSSCHNCGVKLK